MTLTLQLLAVIIGGIGIGVSPLFGFAGAVLLLQAGYTLLGGVAVAASVVGFLINVVGE